MKSGDTIKLFGPEWFPFVHYYIVERVSGVGNAERMKYVVTLRLAEYHGPERVNLSYTATKQDPYCMMKLQIPFGLPFPVSM